MRVSAPAERFRRAGGGDNPWVCSIGGRQRAVLPPGWGGQPVGSEVSGRMAGVAGRGSEHASLMGDEVGC